MVRQNVCCLLVLSALSTLAVAQERGFADLVVTNATIVTGDPQDTEVTAIAIKGDTIMAVGSDTIIATYANPSTRVIDAGGKLILPGLVESHAHLRGIGSQQLQLDFAGTVKPEQVVLMVAESVKQHAAGTWITGRGWDQNDWPAREFPTHAKLSAVSPDHPVSLERVDGHATWVNAKALAIAGITKATKDPEGGRIIRDASGEPTGVLIDTAMDLVDGKIPRSTHAERKRAIQAALLELASVGITTFHDAGVGADDIAIYKELQAAGGLTSRIYVMLDGSNKQLLDHYLARGPEIGLGNDTLTIRSIKLFADGALGSRGAALLEPYSDDPKNTGVVITTEDQIYQTSKAALAAGFQVATHAIGDRGNRLTLNAYERAFKELPAAAKNARFRVEHVQILDEADIPRFAKLGVIASMQATHCTSDMPWVDERLGAARAAEGAYVWQKLLRSGARLTNGSDAPVESVNPLWGIYAAVTRQDQSGQPAAGWLPTERLTMEEAIHSFTAAGAYAGFSEDKTGVLAAGKKADLVMMSKDFTKGQAKDILSTKAVMTIMGGKITYQDMPISSTTGGKKAG